MSTRTITKADFAETIATGTVLVDFWASWCPPCRMFAPTFEAVAAKHPEAVFAKVDTEAEPELTAALRIGAIPTLMVFRDGVLVHRASGALPASALEELLRRVAALDMDSIRKKLAEAAA